MVARDERAHLAASHFQVFASGIEIGLDTHNLGVHDLDVIAGGLGSEFRVYRSIQRGQLLGSSIVEFGRFVAGLFELALCDLQFTCDNLQISLEIGVGLFVLSKAVL